MVDAAPWDEDERVRYLRELENELGVAGWRTPGRATPAYELNRDPAAPAWWHGDEEASQSFIQAMGVNLDG